MSVIPNGIGWDRLARLFRMPRQIVSDVHVLSLVCIARMIECSCARACLQFGHVDMTCACPQRLPATSKRCACAGELRAGEFRHPEVALGGDTGSVSD